MSEWDWAQEYNKSSLACPSPYLYKEIENTHTKVYGRGHNWYKKEKANENKIKCNMTLLLHWEKWNETYGWKIYMDGCICACLCYLCLCSTSEHIVWIFLTLNMIDCAQMVLLAIVITSIYLFTSYPADSSLQPSLYLSPSFWARVSPIFYIFTIEIDI